MNGYIKEADYFTKGQTQCGHGSPALVLCNLRFLHIETMNQNLVAQTPRQFVFFFHSAILLLITVKNGFVVNILFFCGNHPLPM